MDTHNRRDVLFLLGSAAAAAVVGCRSDASGQSLAGAAAPGCVVTPEQTEGPYFVDERLHRSDIRTDPSSGLVKAGVPLALTLRISHVSASGCAPLEGTLVDLWHCDAEGAYSDVRDRRVSTVGQKFLRGYQVSGADGRVTFRTIYPGWYPGRAVHIHFKVRTNPAAARGEELTSQLYFDEQVTDLVHARAPYDALGRRNTLNATDGIFRQGGSRLVLPLVEEGDGYRATFDIGVQRA